MGGGLMFWRRKKRLVRVHLEGDAPSLEGVFVGFWAGHYVLRVATLLEGADASVELDGASVRVPRERVLFVQELTR